MPAALFGMPLPVGPGLAPVAAGCAGPAAVPEDPVEVAAAPAAECAAPMPPPALPAPPALPLEPPPPPLPPAAKTAVGRATPNRSSNGCNFIDAFLLPPSQHVAFCSHSSHGKCVFACVAIAAVVPIRPSSRAGDLYGGKLAHRTPSPPTLAQFCREPSARFLEVTRRAVAGRERHPPSD